MAIQIGFHNGGHDYSWSILRVAIRRAWTVATDKLASNPLQMLYGSLSCLALNPGSEVSGKQSLLLVVLC